MYKDNVLEFLKILYGNNPPNGILVLWTKPGNKSRFFDVNHFEQVADKACQLSQDYDVYFGVGLLAIQPEQGRGTADTVVSIPGLWLDIDILVPYNNAKNKKLPPNEEAAKA